MGWKELVRLGAIMRVRVGICFATSEPEPEQAMFVGACYHKIALRGENTLLLKWTFRQTRAGVQLQGYGSGCAVRPPMEQALAYRI